METLTSEINNSSTSKLPKIKFLEKFGYGTYELSMNVLAQYVSTFLLFFYTNVFNLLPATAGIIMSLDRAWCAASDPLLGFISDNHRFKSGQRAKPFLIFCIPLAVLIVLIFTTFEMPYYLKVAYALITLILYDTLRTLVFLPSFVLPMVATNDQKQRVSLLTYMSGGASAGVVIAMLLCWPLVRLIGGVAKDGTVINQPKGFFFSAVFVTALVLIGTLFHYFTSYERVKSINEKEEKLKVFKTFKVLLTCKVWTLNLAYTLLYGLSNVMVTSCLVYFSTYVLKNQGAVTMIMASYALGSFSALPVVGIVNKRLGRKKMMYFGAGVYLLSKLVWMVNPCSYMLTYINGFLMGVGVTFIIVIMRSNVADAADLIEWQNGRRMDNMASTLTDLIGKIGGALSILAIGIVLQLGNYDAKLSIQPTSAINAIKILIIYVPLAFDAMMLFIASRMNIEEEVAKMNAWKKERNLI